MKDKILDLFYTLDDNNIELAIQLCDSIDISPYNDIYIPYFHKTLKYFNITYSKNWVNNIKNFSNINTLTIEKDPTDHLNIKLLKNITTLDFNNVNSILINYYIDFLEIKDIKEVFISNSKINNKTNIESESVYLYKCEVNNSESFNFNTNLLRINKCKLNNLYINPLLLNSLTNFGIWDSHITNINSINFWDSFIIENIYIIRCNSDQILNVPVKLSNTLESVSLRSTKNNLMSSILKDDKPLPKHPKYIYTSKINNCCINL